MFHGSKNVEKQRCIIPFDGTSPQDDKVCSESSELSFLAFRPLVCAEADGDKRSPCWAANHARVLFWLVSSWGSGGAICCRIYWKTLLSTTLTYSKCYKCPLSIAGLSCDLADCCYSEENQYPNKRKYRTFGASDLLSDQRDVKWTLSTTHNKALAGRIHWLLRPNINIYQIAMHTPCFSKWLKCRKLVTQWYLHCVISFIPLYSIFTVRRKLTITNDKLTSRNTVERPR